MYLFESLDVAGPTFAADSLDVICAELERTKTSAGAEIEMGVRVPDSPIVLYENGREIGLLWTVPDRLIKGLKIPIIFRGK